MSKPSEVIRNYKMPDSEMIQTNRVMHTQFTKDKTLFIGMDSDFSDPYTDKWGNAIVAAEEAGRDIENSNELARLTGVVAACMEKCKTHYQQSKYYIEKAFPNDRKMWNVFGSSEYDSARKTETKLIPFMKSFYNECVKHKDKLIAVGLAQEKIDLTNSLWEELLNADQAQEAFKRERPVDTQGRIETLNAAWEFVVKVNRASKNIFAADYAKLQQYVISDDSSASNDAASTPPTQPPPAQ